MKAMQVLDEGDAKCYRMKATQKRDKNRSNDGWTRAPSRSSGAASNRYYRILRMNNPHMVGVLLQIWNVLTSCSERE